jgi:hypothetical protein
MWANAESFFQADSALTSSLVLSFVRAFVSAREGPSLNLWITRKVIALQWFADASIRAPWRAWRTTCDRLTLKNDVGVRATRARRLL